jgi:hypothetical protein
MKKREKNTACHLRAVVDPEDILLGGIVYINASITSSCMLNAELF